MKTAKNTLRHTIDIIMNINIPVARYYAYGARTLGFKIF